MRIRLLGLIAALATLSFSSATAAAGCQLQQLGVLPVEMRSMRPFVWTTINGAKARFELDTGSFYSMMSRDAAAQFKLHISSVGGGSFYIRGMGGSENASMTTVKSFGLLGATVSDIQFLVIGQSFGYESAGLLGQNVLRMSDVEYDLGNGEIRFFKPVGCQSRPLAYWALRTPYSSIDLEYMDVTEPHLRSTAVINGQRVTVWFDTGSPRSMLSLDAARRAGITPSSPGVTFLGSSGGIGPASGRVWSAPIDVFQLGNERIEHTHLLIRNIEPRHAIGDVSSWAPDLLLGADFFLSHRIYVAYSQNKLYFTYSGGPVFNLDVPQVASGAAKPPATAGGQQAAATADQSPDSDIPTDADGFRRRGMAYASRREFDHALADLTRACELAPGDAESHYDRGMIYAEDGQFKPAVEDLNTVITLQPSDIDAHLMRVELLQSHPDADPTVTAAQTRSDLDTISRLAAPDADVRRTLSGLYEKLGDYAAAIEQIDQWLGKHPDRNDQAIGLNSRCWLRAESNRELHAALDDCNHSLDLKPYAPETLGSHIRTPLASDDPEVLDSRGLVYLRLGNPQDAIRDYGAALAINANLPTALYGRGLAELRLGEKAQGQGDLAAAAKLDKGIAKRFAGMGLAP